MVGDRTGDGKTTSRFHPKSDSLAWARKFISPGTLPKNISHISNYQRGDQAILLARVSTQAQVDAGSLDDQVKHLRAEVESRGGVIIDDKKDVIRAVGSGKQLVWLREAVRLAKKRDAVIVAESIDRLFRPSDYYPADVTVHPSPCRVLGPDAVYSQHDIEQVSKIINGVTILTILDPALSPGEVRGQQTIRGQTVKGNRGGRPHKVKRGRPNKSDGEQRRAALLGRVLELHGQGMTCRQIAEHLSGQVTYRTVHRWIR